MYKTSEEFNAFLARHSEYSTPFQRYMTSFDEGRDTWMDYFPVQKKLGDGANEDKDAIMFVDIGGGMGHVAAALHKRFPNLPGRFILQDLPSVVSEANNEGIEVVAYDFFQPQPARGECRQLHNPSHPQCSSLSTS